MVEVCSMGLRSVLLLLALSFLSTLVVLLGLTRARELWLGVMTLGGLSS